MLPTAFRRLASTARPPPKLLLRSAMRARPPPPSTTTNTNTTYNNNNNSSASGGEGGGGSGEGEPRFWKTKKVWPPDFARLSPKEQFRFERRYKRRVRLATARPRWDRAVRMAQLCCVTLVLVYCVLFMEWDSEVQPFQGIRDKFWGAVGGYAPEPRFERRGREVRDHK